MTFSPRIKLLFILGGVFLVGRGRISLIFSLGDKNNEVPVDDFAANIQQAIPQEIPKLQQQEIQPKELPIQQPVKKPEPVIKQLTAPQYTQSQITIIVPPLIDKKQRAAIQQAIDARSGQKTRLLYYPTRELYTNAIQQSLTENNNHDIVVVPSLWFLSYSQNGLKFAIDERSGSLFHPMMKEWLFHSSMTIIPFALDPYIIASRLTTNPYQSTATIIDQINKDSNAFAVTPGLHTGKETLEQFAIEGLFNNILVKAVRTGAKRRVSFLLLDNQGVVTESDCQGSLAWCAFTAGTIQATIMPLSQVAHLEIAPALHPLPLATDDYPILARGFIVPLSSDNQSAAAQWLAAYLELSSEGGVPYPQHLFAASMRTLQRQRIEQQYALIQDFFNAKTVISGSISDVRFAQSVHVANYLKGKLSLDHLLQKIGDVL